jgi:hypothetical protein
MLERDIFNEPTDHDFERDTSEFNNTTMIDQDEYRMKNLARMISKAETVELARLWEIKLAELMRNVKQRSLKNQTHGYEFIGGTS